MSRYNISVDYLSTLNDLCLDKILSLLSPSELLAVGGAGSRKLKIDAESNIYWEKYVTSIYQSLIERATEPLNFLSLKQLYCRLVTRPFILDEGKLIFSQNLDCGKYSYMIGARSFEIAGQHGWDVWFPDDDPRSLAITDHEQGWVWGSDGDSRFPDVAMLLYGAPLSFICRLETCLLSDKTDYVVYLLFKITDDGYGFKSEPVTVGFDFVDLVGDSDDMKYHDDGEAIDIYFDVGDHVDESVKVPRRRDDSWMEVEIAKFFINHCDERDVIVVMAGDECPPMHGLILEGIEVRPKM